MQIFWESDGSALSTDFENEVLDLRGVLSYKVEHFRVPDIERKCSF